jgi:hypothetical protein
MSVPLLVDNGGKCVSNSQADAEGCVDIPRAGHAMPQCQRSLGPAQSRRGPGLVRRITATSWRSSTTFDDKAQPIDGTDKNER